jgi:hypothetical protein
MLVKLTKELQRLREGHLHCDILLSASHGHGVGESPEDVGIGLYVTSRWDSRTLCWHKPHLCHRNYLLAEF